MRRRIFIAMVSGMAAWPFAAQKFSWPNRIGKVLADHGFDEGQISDLRFD